MCLKLFLISFSSKHASKYFEDLNLVRPIIVCVFYLTVKYTLTFCLELFFIFKLIHTVINNSLLW